MSLAALPDRPTRADDPQPPFSIERWVASVGADVTHLAGASDVEPMGLHDLLWLADGDTRRLWDGLELGYQAGQGHPLLRELIAAQYEHVGPDDVLVTTGAQEAIWLLAQTLVGPGNHVVVTGPAHRALRELPAAMGADGSVLSLRHDESWALRATTFEAALSPRTRLALVNFPHSPTGALPDEQTFRQVLATAADNRIRAVSNEVYRRTERDPADRLPAAADVDELAVSVGGLSKAFGLGGLRIGWVATRDDELRARLRDARDATTICPAGPSQILAIIALQHSRELLDRTWSLLDQGHRAWTRLFERWSDTFEWVPPKAGTVAFPRLRADVPIEHFCEELLRETGVALVPGSVYAVGDGHFRIGLGRRDLDVATEKIDAFARRWLSAY